MSRIDHAAVERLLRRVRRDVDEGVVPSAQVALALDGDVVVDETIGDATPETRYLTYSAIKPLVALAVLRLVADGRLSVEQRVAELVPGFAANGKEGITVEHLLVHTAGLAGSVMPLEAARDPQLRCVAFAEWRPSHQPGEVYQYHPTAGHWVLVDLLERVTSLDPWTIVAATVTDPIGLPCLLGDVPVPAAPPVLAGGDPARAAPLLALGNPAVQRVGIPGGGGVARAADLALVYQDILHDPDGRWGSATLALARDEVRQHLPEVGTAVPGNRTLAFVQAGDDGWAEVRGFGTTTSARTIGHHGAGCQIAWGDPVSGLSFAHLTDGLDLDPVREPARRAVLSALAGAAVTR